MKTQEALERILSGRRAQLRGCPEAGCLACAAEADAVLVIEAMTRAFWDYRVIVEWSKGYSFTCATIPVDAAEAAAQASGCFAKLPADVRAQLGERP